MSATAHAIGLYSDYNSEKPRNLDAAKELARIDFESEPSDLRKFQRIERSVELMLILTSG